MAPFIVFTRYADGSHSIAVNAWTIQDMQRYWRTKAFYAQPGDDVIVLRWDIAAAEYVDHFAA